MLKRSIDRGLVTLLFTDIVGSSDVAAEVGDRRWRRLQARHHAIVRGELKRFSGREIDTAGDGFFATFEVPAAAVRCAAAIVEAVRECGLEVRAGLHFGEAERAGEKLGGIAVSTAARVAGAAGVGEILVTSTIVDVVMGSGLEFSDHGPRALKGIPGTWHLFALATVDGEPVAPPLDPDTAANARNRASPLVTPMPRRRRVLAPVLGGVLTIALTGWFVATRGGPPLAPPAQSSPESSAIAGSLVVKLDANSGEVTPVDVPHAGVDVPAGPIVLTKAPAGRPQAFAWVVSAGGPGNTSTLSQVDRASGISVHTYPTTKSCISPRPCLVAAHDRVWFPISNRGAYEPGLSIEGIAPGSGKTILPVSRTAQLSSIQTMVFGGDAMWIGDTVDEVIFRVDLRSGAVQQKDVGQGVDLLAYGEGSLWVVDSNDPRLMRVDPETLAQRRILLDADDPSSMTTGGGYLWVTDASRNELQRIPIDLRSPDRIRVGDHPDAIVYAHGFVWVANQADGTVWRLNSSFLSDTKKIPVGILPRSLAVDGNEVWVAGDPAGIDRS